ncbi:hypothetical protein EDD17DRAFT_714241 [Pisolithus thermaeus]|nr:hypothetical protein EV401DRAFT_114531 [Pisolithus croceorrhizus]KAI6161022.1 hypothetical protein EDD17DRAFT_714241 [Pisolithus thermaeus]
MATVPQTVSPVMPTLDVLSAPTTQWPFYQSPYFITAAGAVAVLIISLAMCRVRTLRRSRRPLSDFFVRRKEPGPLLGELQSAGTLYERYRTTPSPIGIPRRSSDSMRSVDTDQSWRPFSAFYAADGYSKETLPVYDSVGSPPRYGQLQRAPNRFSAVQPSSVGPSVPPPAYRGLRNS